MRSFVEKLTGQNLTGESISTYDRAMFGSGRDMSKALESTSIRPAHRIGLWPILSETDPELAMGIGSVLALLLERYRSVRAYRLFVRLDGEPSEYRWSVKESQFSVDDWFLDGLDENAALWGELVQTAAGWQLSLDFENDLGDSDDVEHFKRTASTLSGLVASLPSLAQEIIGLFGTADTTIDALAPDYELEDWQDSLLQLFAKMMFQLDLHLMLDLWGATDSGREIQRIVEALLKLAAEANTDLFFWGAAHGVSRALSPLHIVTNDLLLPRVESIAEQLLSKPSAGIILGAGLMRLRYPLRAYDVLEESLSVHADHSASYLALGELYRTGNDVAGTLDAYQRCIERGVDSSEIDMRYADLLLLMDASNIWLRNGVVRQTASGREYVERFVFIDEEELDSNEGQDAERDLLILEALAALEAVLEVDPQNIDALGSLALQQVDLNDPNLWDTFERLVQADSKGDVTRTVVDVFYNLPDIQPGVDILNQAANDQPDRIDLKINLSVALLAIDDGEKALKVLEGAATLSTDSRILAEIERLMLSADDPDFEARLGEIVDLVNSGKAPSPDDVDFLEDTLERAPRLAEVYVLLANAYRYWNEREDALNVLLDGQKQIPHDPEIAMLLARMLWEADEHDLAFECLNKALAHNPRHPGLLATVGQYLFEDGQEAIAREMLMRAEALDPRHSALQQARTVIARLMNDSK